MLTSEFDFDLPDDLIAQYPIEPRDRARLMVIDRRQGTWEHRIFAELPEILRPGDILARNNTRVLPARLIGHRVRLAADGKDYFSASTPVKHGKCLQQRAGRPVLGEHVIVGQGLHLVLEARGKDGLWIVRPRQDDQGNESTTALLERHGQTPLPPYIHHGRETAADRSAYQTVYARSPGSAAAPTAGLHFTNQVFSHLAERDISWVDLTLHIGVGTFRPIQAERIEDHVMHAEWAELPALAAATIEARRREGGKIIAVGTTAARTLETAAIGEKLEPFSGDTRLFIRPGHIFRGFDALLTNFHLPRSSLLVLVSAFAGLELTRAAYTEAIRYRYRFFSYGDAMLIL